MPHKHSHSAEQARLHINLRLERWHRRCIYVAMAALFATGVAWLLGHFFLRTAGQFGESVSPLEPLSMKLHGASVMVVLFLLGSLMNSHIRRAFKSGRNLASGWAMIGTLLFLTATGFGLYYLAGEADRPTWSALHWVAGLGMGLLFIAHIAIGRRSNPHRGAGRG